MRSPGKPKDRIQPKQKRKGNVTSLKMRRITADEDQNHKSLTISGSKQTQSHKHSDLIDNQKPFNDISEALSNLSSNQLIIPPDHIQAS